MAARKAVLGDWVRIKRPRGHSIPRREPCAAGKVGRVFRVAGTWSDGRHTFYRGARFPLWLSFRSDELEAVAAPLRRGRPSKRALRNRRWLQRHGLLSLNVTAGPQGAVGPENGESGTSGQLADNRPL